MLPTERISYSAITERPRLSLPDGARVAVWVIVNVEEWDARQAMPRTVLTPPAGGSPMPDIPNWAWHEYGNRVGFWRFVEVFDALSIRPVLAINGSALAAYPAIVRAAVERNWEFIGHGFTQRNMQKVKNERADIRRTRDAILKATGTAPRLPPIRRSCARHAIAAGSSWATASPSATCKRSRTSAPTSARRAP
jgi:allantoinase